MVSYIDLTDELESRQASSHGYTSLPGTRSLCRIKIMDVAVNVQYSIEPTRGRR